LAENHFRRRGDRHFGCCGNRQCEWSGWRQEFFSGLLAADRMPCATFQFAGSAKRRRRLGAWLKSLPKPVGLFTAKDLCGHGALEACSKPQVSCAKSIV
jgi:LacI family transcriptional regulator